ncbi:MAG: thioredoxin family protein [Candidatus Altiarchaeota archaeon]|nr:thioredoxin family protein [Candidatus Altiarchaeota archaeon]
MKRAIFLVLGLLLLSQAASALEANASQGNVTVYFFWGDGCPHCEEEWNFIRLMQEKYPGLTVVDYEVWHNQTKADYLLNVSQAYGIVPKGTPVTFIGDKYYNGFTWEMSILMEQDIQDCLNNGCVSPDVKCRSYIENQSNQTSCKTDDIVSFNFFGREYTLDPKTMSLPLFTLIIAGLDGFNPCAMWVLCFLLALLVYTKSRERMFLVGGTFILASGVMYFLFMTAWLNVFLFVGYMAPTRIAIGLLAAFAGLINIKDFFAFKIGPSLTIPESVKSTIFSKMRSLVNNVALPATLLGTIALAFTVNLVELLCTAGFPAIYTRVLTMSNLAPLENYMYLAFYNFIYMFDDLVVFSIAVITLSSKKITETQGRWMKLIGGVLMLTLGLLLVFKPDILMF